jgi:hypothetical protein
MFDIMAVPKVVNHDVQTRLSTAITHMGTGKTRFGKRPLLIN